MVLNSTPGSHIEDCGTHPACSTSTRGYTISDILGFQSESITHYGQLCENFITNLFGLVNKDLTCFLFVDFLFFLSFVSVILLPSSTAVWYGALDFPLLGELQDHYVLSGFPS